ncbi:sugar ABC transporter ATP-binding protein [Lichenicoccus sp.]|uniref:sugar ABC transporter ATP-binding protein n=1 Tax=Lichenicoccus sp. TaxID=2781899 RepID=UPI003D13952F
MSPGATLAADGLGKSYGGVAVLSEVSLSVRPGELRAVLGENGAGKSTLMQLLSGHRQPDHGRVLLDGQPVHLASPMQAERLGIVLVHQEQLLAEQLTVAENLFLGRELRRGPFLDRARMHELAAERLQALGCHAAPGAPVGSLSIAERQMVQIARALLVPRRVVILDEPTAVLTPHEVGALFAAILSLKASGVALLYISHRLAEVAMIADSVTVLRDGRLVTSRPAAGLGELEMARLMVGRDMSTLFPPKPPLPEPSDAPILQVRRARVPGHVVEASFSLQRTEILGFGGLVGAGRTELFEGLIGLRPAYIEAVAVHGEPFAHLTPRGALRAGIAYLTEDRKGRGLLRHLPLATNLTLVAPFQRFGLLDAARESAAMQQARDEFDIRAGRSSALAGQLSGGNQQKLMLAKTMLTRPRILVIDEPTRGIDIGTKAQIYRFIAALAAAGTAVVVISSEMQELIGLCHRVLVMRHGRIVAELEGDAMTEDAIVVHATGVGERAA